MKNSNLIHHTPARSPSVRIREKGIKCRWLLSNVYGLPWLSHMIFVRCAAVMIVLALTLLQTGCATSPEHQVVDLSALDYIEMRKLFYSARGHDRYPVRLELIGGGYLEMLSGHSERVSSGFWNPKDDPSWHDFKKDYRMLNAVETQHVFQRFVDAGGLSRERRNPEGDLLVVCQIGFDKVAFITDDPEYNDLFDELYSKFHQ